MTRILLRENFKNQNEEAPGTIAGFRSRKSQYTASHDESEIRGVLLLHAG
jgi:hypothetical protein